MVISCRQDFDEKLPTQKLKLSVNVIDFHTTFTQIVSPTYQLKITNTENSDILIPLIQLQKGSNSYYKLEVDGIKNDQNSYNDVLVRKHDSIILYLTIIAKGKDNIRYEDYVLLKLSNDLIQRVKLTSNVEKATVFKSSSKDKKYKITTNTTWNATSSKIIYDSLIVSNRAKLTIEKGTKIYFHSGAKLNIEKGSELIVKGTKDKKVTFRGYRTEPSYDTLTGTWQGIKLEKNSIGTINYAYINGAKTAIRVEQADLSLTNTQIYNSQQFGLFAQNANIKASNLVVNQAARFSVFLNKGGNYDFQQCTLVNYWPFTSQERGALYLSNIQNKNGVLTYANLNASFANNIIFSRQANGLTVSIDKKKAKAQFLFDTNLINEGSEDVDFVQTFLKGNILNKDPMLKSASGFSRHDLRLMLASPALDVGKLSVAQKNPTDILGKSRSTKPDLGAYESN